MWEQWTASEKFMILYSCSFPASHHNHKHAEQDKLQTVINKLGRGKQLKRFKYLKMIDIIKSVSTTLNLYKHTRFYIQIVLYSTAHHTNIQP